MELVGTARLLTGESRRAKAPPAMTSPSPRANYRLGSLYALVTAVLVATQEPFSALAARRLSSSYFIFLTQFALLLSVPLLTLPRSSRREFIRLFANIKNLGKLAILFIFGLCGLLLYYVGLSSAHPIITATIFNLSPFWAALVAIVVSRKPIPVSPSVFLWVFCRGVCGRNDRRLESVRQHERTAG
jgi:drug/metabolite transporter (DMT)-like permease